MNTFCFIVCLYIVFSAGVTLTGIMALAGINPKQKDSPRPDVTATREWVADIINSKTSNCMMVGGTAHQSLQKTDEKSRAYINIALAKAQELRTPKMLVLAFGYFQDAIWFEHLGVKYKAVVKVGLYDIPTANQPLPVPCSDEEYQLAWEDFDGFWQANGSVGIMFESVVRVPLGVDPASQTIGTTCYTDLIEAWKFHGMPEYHGLDGNDPFYCKYVCNGTYKLSMIGGHTCYHKAH